MSRENTKNVDDLVAQRREIDRQIKAAKRAQKKAAEASLLSARQGLGVDLAMAVGADSLDAVERLVGVLMSGQMIDWMKGQVDTGSSDNSATGDGEVEVEVEVVEGGDHNGTD